MDSQFGPFTFRRTIGIVAAALVLASVAPVRVRAQVIAINPANMPRIGTVDPRFASYNIEMAEVTGGSFWKRGAARAPEAGAERRRRPGVGSLPRSGHAGRSGKHKGSRPLRRSLVGRSEKLFLPDMRL